MFLLLLFFFLGVTGYIMSRMDRAAILRNWTERRCDLTVMIAGRFFRPEGDPRTPSEFASDNFDFCVKEISESFLSKLMAPVSWLMGKQAGMAGTAMTALNQVREMVNRIRDAFLSYVTSYMEKVKGGMKELRRVFIYLRMAVQRMIAIAVSTIYMGMTLFRGMLTTIQVVVRVILIICAIMIAVIIILWFILLPIIPFILTTLTAVVALVGALSVVLSGSLASQAQSQKGGFCFAGETKVDIVRDEKSITIPIREVKIGDVIEGGHHVTMRMEVVGEGVDWYTIDGIYVSGDHRVQDPLGMWNLVRNDKRAVSSPSSPSSPLIYCLNTTTRQIPLRGVSGTVYAFRDWEELEEEDEEGHRLWREAVLRLLNPKESPRPEEVSEELELPWMDPMTKVNTPGGFCPLSELRVGDLISLRTGGVQRVLGIVYGTAHIQAGYRWEEEHQRWAPWKGVDSSEIKGGIGWNLVTETGEWSSPDGSFRDFTEVGSQTIQALYDMVSHRLLRPLTSSITPSSHSS